MRTYAAFVVIARGPQILTITRGDDLADVSIPGGTLEPGETLEQAAVREVFEETGVRIRERDLRPLASWPHKNGEVRTYVLKGPAQFPAVLQSTPFEGHVAWRRPEDLLTASCTYQHRNAVALSRAGLLSGHNRPMDAQRAPGSTSREAGFASNNQLGYHYLG